MKNPLRNTFLKHFPIWCVIQATASLREQGFEVDATSQNPLHWAQVADHCQFILDQLHESPYAQPADDRPAVLAPRHIPTPHYPAKSDVFTALAALGALRGVHLVADSRGGFSLTVKVTLQTGQRVYRYGRLLNADGVEDLIYRWLRKGYWTPDKQ